MNSSFEQGKENSAPNSNDASQLLKDLLNVGKSPVDAMNERSNSSLPMQSSASNGSGLASGSQEDDIGLTVKSASLDLSGFVQTPVNTIKQNIVLQGNDSRGSIAVYGREVIITPSPNSNIDVSAPASSQVTITPVVNYDWENKYYLGNLVAVNCQYLVYVLKIQSGYGVRVLNRRSSERSLIKGFADIIVDIAFSHYNCNILACVDKKGNLSVWQLYDQDGKINCKCKLDVQETPGAPPSDFHRVVWCPYLPSISEDEQEGEEDSTNAEYSRFLAVSHDKGAELWDIEVASEDYGSIPITFADAKDAVIGVTNGHELPITDMAVSPDGSVMATASMDGTVKFWQMYWETADPPRRLHKFKPHSGKAVSSLLFCDNHKSQDPNVPFWRFLLTGTERNSEIKLWCTVSWTCLQEVRFLTPDPQPILKVALDQSASFFMASDIKRKVFYVMKLFQDPNAGQACFSSLTEFLLKQPMLSFAITGAGLDKKRGNDDAEDGDEQSGEFGNEVANNSLHDGKVKTLIKLFGVFSRNLQELFIHFQPTSSIEKDYVTGSVSTTSKEDITLRDGLSDMSFSTAEQSTDAEGSQQDFLGGLSPTRSDSQQPTPAQSVTSTSFTSDTSQSTGQKFLLTPETLKSGTFNHKDALRDSGSSSASSFTHVTRMNMSTVEDLLSPKSPSVVSSVTVNTDTSVTLSPSSLQSSGSVGALTPSQVPLPPLSASREASFLEEELLEDENMPRSPPNTPEESDANSLKGQGADSEDIAERLHHHPRLQEKRLSDSSAEVAKIMQKESPSSDEWPKTETKVEESLYIALPVSGPVKPEVSVGSLVDLSCTPIEDPKVSHDNDEINLDAHDRIGKSDDQDKGSRRSWDGSSVDTYLGWSAEADGDRAMSLPADLRDNARSVEEAADEGEEDAPEEEVEDVPPPKYHKNVEELKKQHEESSSATGSDGDSGGDAKPARKHRRHRASPKGAVGAPAVESFVEISASMQQILESLQAQQEEIRKLRQDISKSQQSNSIIQSMKSRVEKLEKSLGTKLETMITKNSELERQRLDTALQEKQQLDRQKQDRLIEAVSNTLKQSVTQRLDKSIRAEIESKVIPEMQQTMAPLANQLSAAVAQKLTATDQLMRENISKLIKSKGTTDAIAQATAQMVATNVSQSYKELFFNNVMPAFDNACKSMFQQIGGSFQNGTENCLRQLQMRMDGIMQNQKQESEMVVAELRSLVDQQQKQIENLRVGLLESMKEELGTQLEQHMQRLSMDVSRTLHNLVQTEFTSVLKEHHNSVQESIESAVRSHAATPIPQQPDIHRVQSQIMSLLQQKKINDAFQVALNAADLRALVYACRKAEIDDVFSCDGCALEQPVLLSLIHQLSHDLTSDTDLKCTYLDESIMAIDEDSPITKGHLPGILGDLFTNIADFMHANPGHACFKKLRRINKLAHPYLSA